MYSMGVHINLNLNRKNHETVYKLIKGCYNKVEDDDDLQTRLTLIFNDTMEQK